jgi:hypothetical protein
MNIEQGILNVEFFPFKILNSRLNIKNSILLL